MACPALIEVDLNPTQGIAETDATLGVAETDATLGVAETDATLSEPCPAIGGSRRGCCEVSSVVEKQA